jgi:hypothetical protein
MTQRKWKTEDGWQVLTGWDRPLSHFFVNIDRGCRGCDGEGIITDATGGPEGRECTTCEGSGTEYLFNNLDDNSGMTDRMGGMTLENVMYVLSITVTKTPVGLMERLRLDKSWEVGNDVTDYGVLGKEVGG